jgi:hypothetical protein
MTIRFACECGQKFKARDDKVGKKIICQGCGKTVVVPESETAPVEDIAPVEEGRGLSAADAAAAMMAHSGGGGEAEKDTGGGGGASAAAAAFSSKTAGKRGFGSSERDDRKDDEVDPEAEEFRRLLYQRILPGAGGVLVVCLLLYWLMNAMVSTDRELPELGYVEGVVTLNGAPLENAFVTFTPLLDANDKRKNIASSVGRTNAEGEYVLKYLQDVEGAAVGKHTVKISKTNLDGTEAVPPRYSDENRTDKVIKEVEPGSNEIDFKLTPGE